MEPALDMGCTYFACRYFEIMYIESEPLASLFDFSISINSRYKHMSIDVKAEILTLSEILFLDVSLCSSLSIFLDFE